MAFFPRTGGFPGGWPTGRGRKSSAFIRDSPIGFFPRGIGRGMGRGRSRGRGIQSIPIISRGRSRGRGRGKGRGGRGGGGISNATKTKTSNVNPEKKVLTAVNCAIGQLRVAIEAIDPSCSAEMKAAKGLLEKFLSRAGGTRGQSIVIKGPPRPPRKLATFTGRLTFANGGTGGIRNQLSGFKRPLRLGMEQSPPLKKQRITISPTNPGFIRLLEEFDEKEGGFCKTCEVHCPGKDQWESHLRGKKHISKMRWVASVGPDVVFGPTMTVTAAGKEQFHCTSCKITCSGRETWQLHLAGKKHQKKVNPKESAPQFKYRCEICNVACTGEHQMELHLAGRKHLSAVSGDKKPKVKIEMSSDSKVVGSSDEKEEPEMFEIRTHVPGPPKETEGAIRKITPKVKKEPMSPGEKLSLGPPSSGSVVSRTF